MAELAALAWTRAVPKIELHLHLDACLSFDVARQLDGHVTRESYAEDFVAPAKCHDLMDLLKRIDRPLELMQDEDALRAVTDDLFDQLRDDGVVYAEVRFAPLLHTRGGLKPERVLETVADAARAASRRTAVAHGVIVCTLRHFTAEESRRTADVAVASGAPNVVGFDIAGDEARFGLDAHVAAFDLVREAGFGLTAHAGEAAGAASVAEALDRLRPSRIGHGVRSAESDDLVARLKREGTHLEVCPTSNVQSDVCGALRDHPIDRLWRAGVSLGVNTDGRALCGVSLSEEYARVADAFGWTEDHFLRANRAAVEACFAPPDVTRDVIVALEGP